MISLSFTVRLVLKIQLAKLREQSQLTFFALLMKVTNQAIECTDYGILSSTFSTSHVGNFNSCISTVHIPLKTFIIVDVPRQHFVPTRKN
jgi:hypothetical protein